MLNLLLLVISAYSAQTPRGAGFPGMMPPMMQGCAMWQRNPKACKAHFPMCQWVFDEDMWTCMESGEVESSKDFWTAQNMPGAPEMSPAMAAMISANEGELPSDMPMMLPPIAAGSVPSLPQMPTMPQAPVFNPATVNAGGMMPGMTPFMMQTCEMIHNAKKCAAAPGCTWILDDNMMACIETKEVENNKAFWIGQQGQMFPQGPPGMMTGQAGVPGTSPSLPGMAGGMPPMMMSCEMIRDPTQCRARMPMCQWVMDEGLWACMEAKEVENQKDFWTMHNMAGGKMPPFTPTAPATQSSAAATQTTAEATDGGSTSPAAFLQRARLPSNQHATQSSSSDDNNTLLLACVTVLGFSFGIVMALLGLHYGRSNKQNLESILLDQTGVVRQV